MMEQHRLMDMHGDLIARADDDVQRTCHLFYLDFHQTPSVPMWLAIKHYRT
jgi:hypothetical protein